MGTVIKRFEESESFSTIKWFKDSEELFGESQKTVKKRNKSARANKHKLHCREVSQKK